MPTTVNYTKDTVFGKPNWPREALPNMSEILQMSSQVKDVVKRKELKQNTLRLVNSNYVTQNMTSFGWYKFEKGSQQF